MIGVIPSLADGDRRGLHALYCDGRRNVHVLPPDPERSYTVERLFTVLSSVYVTDPRGCFFNRPTACFIKFIYMAARLKETKAFFRPTPPHIER